MGGNKFGETWLVTASSHTCVPTFPAGLGHAEEVGPGWTGQKKQWGEHNQKQGHLERIEQHESELRRASRGEEEPLTRMGGAEGRIKGLRRRWLTKRKRAGIVRAFISSRKWRKLQVEAVSEQKWIPVEQ